MRKAIARALVPILLMTSTGCLYWPGGTGLQYSAQQAGLNKITTGDGTFENYTAIGHYTGIEFGLAIGIPFVLKLAEIVPMQSNEGLLIMVARQAANDGANAMINVQPHSEFYTGFPFFFVGLYIDKAEGTGIRTR